MTTSQAWFGVIGMAVFTPIMWYSIQIVNNFDAQEDLSLYRIFNSDAGVSAFRWLAISFSVYAASLIVAGFGELANTTLQFTIGVTTRSAPTAIGITANIDRVGAIIAFVGILVFVRTVAHITAQDDPEPEDAS